MRKMANQNTSIPRSITRHGYQGSKLLVITKKDLDRQPIVCADLEAIRQVVELVDLFLRQFPSVEVEVALDALRRDRLGDNVPTLLDTPQKQDLLRCLAPGLGNGL